MNYYGRAILELGYSGTFSVDDESDINSINWYGETEGVPTNEEIQAKSDEIAASIPLKALRDARNRMLFESDWTQGDDVPAEIKTPWTTYRQALRDITETYTSLDDVVWPTKPE
jgi:hypothetical protein